MTSELEHRIFALERQDLDRRITDIEAALRIGESDSLGRVVENLVKRVAELEEPGAEKEKGLRDTGERLGRLERSVRAREERALEREILADARDREVAAREQAVAAREGAVKAREEQYARTVSANPLPAAHPKDAWLTERANGATYAQFIAAGWTDQLLEQYGFMAVPRPVREAVREFNLQHGVNGVFA